MRSTFLSRAVTYQRASGVHEQQQIGMATAVPEHPMVPDRAKLAPPCHSHASAIQLPVVPEVVPDVPTWRQVCTGHVLPYRTASPDAVTALLLQVRLGFVEVTSFESSSSGLAHNPDNFAGVHCRPPELALLEEAGRHRPGQTCSSSASLRLSSTCAPSTSDTTCSTGGGIGRLTNYFLFFTS